MMSSQQEQKQEQGSDRAPETTERGIYPWLAAASLLLCVGAWYAATVNGYATLAAGAAAILCGAFALGSRRPIVRNTAITAIIAVGVLMLVVGAFMFVLHKFLG